MRVRCFIAPKAGWLNITEETFYGKIRKGSVLMGNLIVGALLAAAVAFVIRGMVRDKKNGKSLQCGCDCSRCGGHCAKTGNQKSGDRKSGTERTQISGSLQK